MGGREPAARASTGGASLLAVSAVGSFPLVRDERVAASLFRWPGVRDQRAIATRHVAVGSRRAPSASWGDHTAHRGLRRRVACDARHAPETSVAGTAMASASPVGARLGTSVTRAGATEVTRWPDNRAKASLRGPRTAPAGQADLAARARRAVSVARARAQAPVARARPAAGGDNTIRLAHRRGRGSTPMRVVERNALRSLMAAAERPQTVPGVGPHRRPWARCGPPRSRHHCISSRGRGARGPRGDRPRP